jgi:hypothetical protein
MKYLVVFHGLSGSPDLFRRRMRGFGAPAHAIERMMEEAPLILKRGLQLEYARRYADAITQAGGLVTVAEHRHPNPVANRAHDVSIASFGSFTMCPRCGFKQLKKPVCDRCGFRFNEFEAERRS